MSNSASSTYPRYGVRLTHQAPNQLAAAAETLALVGYAVIESGVSAAQLADLRNRFDALHTRNLAEHTPERLRAAGEIDLVRCPLAEDQMFLELACNASVLSLCDDRLGPGFILNQQNGIINPAGGKPYSQSAYHRDLPYQHFVSSRPLAINALFCLDPFTAQNGATLVIPASHKQEECPSDSVIRAEARQIEAPAGSFLVLDCMTYHCGGINHTDRDRRAINHVYTIAMIRQQIDLPAYLGPNFGDDPSVRQLLGFRNPTARSVRDFVEQRMTRA